MNVETGFARFNHSSFLCWTLKRSLHNGLSVSDGGLNPQPSFWTKIKSKVYLKSIWAFRNLSWTNQQEIFQSYSVLGIKPPFCVTHSPPQLRGETATVETRGGKFWTKNRQLASPESDFWSLMSASDKLDCFVAQNEEGGRLRGDLSTSSVNRRNDPMTLNPFQSSYVHLTIVLRLTWKIVNLML